MSDRKNRLSGSRRRPSGTGLVTSDEFLYGITRGAFEPLPRDAVCQRNNWSGARPTFEQTYPKQPFSELVRLSLVTARWLAGRLSRESSGGADLVLNPGRRTASRGR